ncbi:MAG TPA: hypothetical protein VH373_18360 [Jatrophihabitantaceae bacterium]
MSNYIMTFTATPRPRSESAFTVLGAGTGMGMPADQARWALQPGSHVEANRNVGQSTGIQGTPIFISDRVVNAAKPGSPPRGNPR